MYVLFHIWIFPYGYIWQSIYIVAYSCSSFIIFTIFRYVTIAQFICPFTGDSAKNAEAFRYAGSTTQKNLGLWTTEWKAVCSDSISGMREVNLHCKI